MNTTKEIIQESINIKSDIESEISIRPNIKRAICYRLTGVLIDLMDIRSY